MITARVVADSITKRDERLTTFVVSYPRFIHSEIMTHRAFSRNASSSRAIPVAKIMAAIQENPAMPEYWGANQAGMQAAEELTPTMQLFAKDEWLKARNSALLHVGELQAIGLHKQIANRVLEPWMHITVIISATEWDNFYWLRTDAQAQPEFRILAERMLVAHNASDPITLRLDEWHLPFVSTVEQAQLGLEMAKKASVARCARVSYNNHDGTNPDLVKDADLHDRLQTSGHSSPFEHQATPFPGRHGNFNGWLQYRQIIPNENRTDFPGLLRKYHVEATKVAPT